MSSTSTKIEWTDTTWSPVRGCSLVSKGCERCYAMKQAHRFSGPGKPYEGLTELGPQGPRWTGKIRLVPEALEEPLHWKKPRRVFVNSMSDLFHEDVPDEFIDQVMARMICTNQHTYQILTKRPDRMQRYFAEPAKYRRWNEAINKTPGKPAYLGGVASGWWGRFSQHIWLGVSVEDQKTADERIPLLLQTPAAVRFVSAEPLLGPVDLNAVMRDWTKGEPCGKCGVFHPATKLNGCDYELPRLDWVIVGGESGPGARPCDLAWIRSLKDQCQAAGVPVFIKQLGGHPYLEPQPFLTTRRTFLKLKDKKGGDWNEWPTDLKVREWPR